MNVSTWECYFAIELLIPLKTRREEWALGFLKSKEMLKKIKSGFHLRAKNKKPNPKSTSRKVCNNSPKKNMNTP